MSISTEISRLQGAKSDLKTSIENKGVPVPTSATLDDYAALVDLISQGTPNLQSKTFSANPTESAQTETVTSDSGYDGLASVVVSVGAISSTYVGSGVPQNDSSDLTASGATVTVPSGYYANNATKTVTSGTAGTPTATKGTVSNHSVSVTPSVTNTTGYITGSTITGTAVTVSANELVSGSQTLTANDTYDVTNLASVTVNVGGESKNAQAVQSTTRTTSTSYTQLSGEITVAKTGTYDVYWTATRSSTSGTWGTQLYIGSSSYGSQQTSYSNHVQNVHLSNVSLTAGQTISVRGRSRGNGYYAYVPMLTIIEA